ncbi:hypothetical protein PIB30_027788 [Stylosanthes scabra]|uniref:Ribonuclease H1 N-terminal domain-containing protein n=1 Tax=Stylosanthes scabra TaxID=79078 RepID=A0ABU6RB01_9FABA|nr:hypothetical protein [Stylosanthes scabra]
MAGGGGQEYWVVFKGRNPGIYTIWEAADTQVSGFPSILHPKCFSLDAATKAWKEYLANPSGVAVGEDGAPEHGGSLYGSTIGGGPEENADGAKAESGKGCMGTQTPKGTKTIGETLKELFSAMADMSPGNGPGSGGEASSSQLAAPIRTFPERFASLERRVHALEMERCEILIAVAEAMRVLARGIAAKDVEP